METMIALGAQVKGLLLVQVGNRYGVSIDGVEPTETYNMRGQAELVAAHLLVDRIGVKPRRRY